MELEIQRKTYRDFYHALFYHAYRKFGQDSSINTAFGIMYNNCI